MDGVASLSVKDNAASFIFRGNVNQLLRALSGLTLESVTIQEPDLEEIFLHYYQ
jgi:ABC-2 type transport system ATP-binding protein